MTPLNDDATLKGIEGEWTVKKYLNEKWNWPIKAHCSYDVGKVINNIIK